MKNLANKEITVLNAVTRVNSTSKNSFLTGFTIKIKEGGFVDRTDGCFYRTTINEKEYRIFCDFMENKMYLNEVNNLRAKTIIIDSYEIVEENLNTFIEVKGQDVIGVLCVNDKREGFLNYVNKFSAFVIDSEDDKAIKLVYEQAKKFCESKNINLIMY